MTLKAPVGPVVPGSVQFRAQHSRAVETWGASPFILAFSQQSDIPDIGQSCSPECVGTPASVPPIMAARRTIVVHHFIITMIGIVSARAGVVKLLCKAVIKVVFYERCHSRGAPPGMKNIESIPVLG